MSNPNDSRLVFIDRLNDDLRLANIARRNLSNASTGKIGEGMSLIPTDEDSHLLQTCRIDVFNHAYVTFHVKLEKNDMDIVSGGLIDMTTEEFITKSLPFWCMTLTVCRVGGWNLRKIGLELDSILMTLYPISWKRLKDEYAQP